MKAVAYPSKRGLVVELQVEGVGCLMVPAVVAVKLVVDGGAFSIVIIETFGDMVKRLIYTIGIGLTIYFCLKRIEPLIDGRQ